MQRTRLPQALAGTIMGDLIAEGQRALSRYGAEMTIHGDFAAFASVDRDTAIAFPGYFNETTNADRGMCVLIHKDGETIGTYACGLYLPVDTMAEYIDEIGLHHACAKPDIEIFGTVREWFEAMEGPSAFSGGIWVRPDLRGTELSRLLVPFLPMIGRSFAVDVWDAKHVFFMVPEIIMKKGIAERYRPLFLEPGATWHYTTPPTPLWFGYAAPVQIMKDALDFISKGPDVLVPTKTRQPAAQHAELVR